MDSREPGVRGGNDSDRSGARGVPLLDFKNHNFADIAPGTIFTLTVPSAITALEYAKEKWSLYIISLAFLIGGLLLGKQHGLDDVACFYLACSALFPSSKILNDSIGALSYSLCFRAYKESQNRVATSRAISNVWNFASSYQLPLALFGPGMIIILSVNAVLTDNYRLAQAFIAGTMLVNITFLLGVSIIVATKLMREKIFDVLAAQTGCALMTLSCATLIVPATFYAAGSPSEHNPHTGGSSIATTAVSVASSRYQRLLYISRGVAVLLMLVYAAFVHFQLKSHHATHFEPPVRDTNNGATNAEIEKPLSVGGALLFFASSVACSVFISRLVIQGFATALPQIGLSPFFVGFIMLPILVCAADTVSIDIMKREPVETVGLCVGCAIQVATYVMPILVFIEWMSDREFTLCFESFEIIVLFGSVVLVSSLIVDGKTNYMEGFMLLVLYLVIALSALEL